MKLDELEIDKIVPGTLEFSWDLNKWFLYVAVPADEGRDSDDYYAFVVKGGRWVKLERFDSSAIRITNGKARITCFTHENCR